MLVSNVIGIGTASFDLVADKCTVYCRAVAVNGADIEGESTETLSFYVNDNENAQVDDTTPVIGNVGLSRVDALYAVVTGTVTSVGAALADTCTVRVNIGSSASHLVVTNETIAAVGPFELNIVGLAGDTTYYYSVEAVDDAGTAAETEPEPFTTIPAASAFGELTATSDQTTFRIAGSMAILGAGTTHVFAKWGDGEWTEIGAFTAASANTAFSTQHQGEWSTPITGYVMCSNACERVFGSPASEPYVTTRSFDFTAIDNATYTWQPVNGDWNGDWNDPAHWSSSKAASRGYPDTLQCTADFRNCTLANPVTVNVNGKFVTSQTKFYGTEASDITFVGTGTNTSSLASGYSQSAINSNSKVEFRDMALTMSGSWEVLRNGHAKTNVTFRLSNVAATCSSYSALSAPYCRAEFVNGTVFTATSKFNMGGLDTVCLIDDSTVNSLTYGLMNADCDLNGNLRYVFKGKAPRLVFQSGFSTFAASPNVSFTFSVPVGGYDEPPIQMTHATSKFVGGSHTCDIHFYVAEDSPALAKSGKALSNMVIVQTAAGMSTDRMETDIGTVPEHHGVPCGAFKYGVGGEPLAEGAALSTARQILLDLQGHGAGAPLVIIAK